VVNISTFIKRNKKLLHLNLDSCQLTEGMLFRIVKCLTRAMSIVALHASGNPGISNELRQILWRRIRAKNPMENPAKIGVDRNWK